MCETSQWKIQFEQTQARVTEVIFIGQICKCRAHSHYICLMSDECQIIGAWTFSFEVSDDWEIETSSIRRKNIWPCMTREVAWWDNISPLGVSQVWKWSLFCVLLSPDKDVSRQTMDNAFLKKLIVNQYFNNLLTQNMEPWIIWHFTAVIINCILML